MDDLIIVKAELDEYDEICKIINDIILELFPHYIRSDGKESTLRIPDEKIKSDIESSFLYKIVMKGKNELIGTVSIIDNEIDSMYLVPFYQKRGYGRHVLSLVEVEKERLAN